MLKGRDLRRRAEFLEHWQMRDEDVDFNSYHFRRASECSENG